ncbi:hypothetical protein GBF38_015833 [Nibea albiflora]|uniref:Uncharacterized protein n=1 Tax=Nibea albiflora TaxID=240163 RepID=A0ACB7FGV1_NIBAL|nr:hypothetical protein GBF38_015833 [Nibea albiflora]
MLSLHHSVFSLIFLLILKGLLTFTHLLPMLFEHVDLIMVKLIEVSLPLGVSCQELTAVKEEESSLEDSTVTLSYRYSRKATGGDYFFWYRQYPGKPPELLISHSGTKNETNSRLSVKVMLDLLFEKVFLDTGPYVDEVLKIPIPEGLTVQFARTREARGALGSMNSINPESTEEHVSEGGNINLTCKYNGSIYNIQWYRQYQRSRPEFLLCITEGRLIHPNDSDFSADINKSEKRVHLKIISAKVTDSAVYYCALQPTVTGNTKTLYKNLWSKDNRILHNIH